MLSLALLWLLSSPADAAPPPTRGAFTVRADPRLCPGPMCGGWWLNALNQRQTVCVDGTAATECYVADIDWAAMGWTPQDAADLLATARGGLVVVWGRQETGHYASFPALGTLVPNKAAAQFTP